MVMGTRNAAFIVNLKVKKSSNPGEVHDAIIEELIRANDGRNEQENYARVGSDDGREERPKYSELKQIPFHADLVKSVAVSPPYCGIVLKNGKACRFKINQDEGLSGQHTEEQTSETYSETSAVPKNIGVDNDISRDIIFADQNETSQKSEESLLLDISVPTLTECDVPSKRQRLSEDVSGLENALQVGNITENPGYEQSFEERRFTELVEMGLNGGCRLESQDQTDNSLTSSFLDSNLPLVPRNFAEDSNSDYSDCALSHGVMPGSTLPFIGQIEEPEESPMLMDDPCSLPLSENTSVFPAIFPAASNISENQSDDMGLPSQEQNERKRPYEYPAGFRTMSDKLSFMHKDIKTDNVASTSASKGVCIESKPCTISRKIPASSVEWIQCDLKGVQFESISALHSEFILVSKNDKKLWSWPIPRPGETRDVTKAQLHPSLEALRLESEEIMLIDCNIIRASIITKNGKICSFFDPILAWHHLDYTPSLIKKLTVPATSFKELENEEIIDLKCGHFYSVVLTHSGKVFWWGLAPDELRKVQKTKRQSRRNLLDAGLNVGDIVALKERKEELGALVIKNQFIDGPMVGKVVRIQDLDKGSDSSDRKQYTVELVESKTRESKPSFKGYNYKTKGAFMSGDVDSKDALKFDWSSDEVIFLEERASAVGSVVAVDGNFVVVNPRGSLENHSEQKLKVCLKSSLTKVTDSTEVIVEGSSEFLVNEDRYDRAIRAKPVCVVDPTGSENQYNGFKAVAVSATKHGLAMLLNRILDCKAFLVQADGLKEDNSKVFTCSTKKRRVEKEFLISDGNVTSEFEAVCAKRCMLDFADVDDSRQENGVTTQSSSTYQSWKGPKLLTLNTFDCSILLDRNNCLYPVQFNTCLLQSGTLEALPFRLLVPIEARYGNEVIDEVTISIVAIPRTLTLAPVIIHDDKESFDEIMQTIEEALEQRRVQATQAGEEPMHVANSTRDEDFNGLECLFEKCSGNQNVLHLCAGNINCSQNSGTTFTADNKMKADEVYMLKRILGCVGTRKIIISLLKDKDSLGCTPFLTAIWTKNFKGALSILRFVLKWNDTEPALFEEAISCKSLFGMTPLHHLVFNTSKLQPKYLLKNALVVSNIPSNYSPRMLLQLFKERYSSAYRACIPVPHEKWAIKTAKEKRTLIKTLSVATDQPSSQKKAATFIPRYERAMRAVPTPPQPRQRYGILNRADALRASAKEGLVMFSDLEEMNQALAEMDRHPLLCKDDRAPTGLTSVARYILQVHRADDPNSENRSKDDLLGRSRPTRHTIPPSLRASTLRLPRGHLFSSAALSSDLAHVRHILPQAITGARLILPREVIVSQAGYPVQVSHDPVSNKADNFNEKAEEDTEMESLVDVLKELLDAHPEASYFVNDQQETALAFYLKNSKRLSPDGLYDLFSKMRPCNPKICVINKLKHIEIKKDLPGRPNGKKSSVSDWHLTSTNDPKLVRQSNTSLDCREEAVKCNGDSEGNVHDLSPKASAISTEQTHSNVISSTSLGKVLPRGLSILDEGVPRGVPSVGLKPTSVTHHNSYEGLSLDDFERLALLAADRARDRTSAIGYESMASPSTPTSSVTKQNVVIDKCTCLDQISSMSEQQARTFIWIISVLTSMDGSVLGTIYGSPCEGAVSKSTGGMDIEGFDQVISHLMSNPVPCVVRTFVVTLLDLFSTQNINAGFAAKFAQSTQKINSVHVLKREHSLTRDAEIIGTYRRFLSSVVRQLSLFLSKERNSDSRLRHKIGRFAKLMEDNVDERAMKRIRSTLRAFSWLAVIEILKAAETTITPVRLGISKAQPRGIVSGMPSVGERPSTLQSAHFMSSILGTNPRVAGTTRRTAEALGCSSHIKRASRRANELKSNLRPTKLVRVDSIEDEDSSKDTAAGASRDAFQQSVGIQNIQGIISPLAWTLDGHIRVSDMTRGRQSLPIPDFLDRRPDPDFVPSIHAGNYYLAQMFSRLVKEAVDLASDLLNKGESKFCGNEDKMPSLALPTTTEKELIHQARCLLSKTWDWLIEVMNSIEEQLMAGEEFDTERFATRSLKMDPSISDGSSLGRPPFLSQSYVSRPEEYLMYLLKAHDASNTNSVFPILDLMSYSHVTVVLDAYLYMLKKWPIERANDSSEVAINKKMKRDSQKDANHTIRGRDYRFFGFDYAAFNAMKFEEARNQVLKKAKSPHFWLIPSQPEQITDKGNEQQKNSHREQCKLNWKLSISAFAKLFLAEPPGMERDCFLAEHAGSAGRIARFQRALGSLKDDCLPKTITEESQSFTANIRRGSFLSDGLKALLHVYQNDNHPYSNIKVRFEGEEGTGPGVNRGFFTGFANALTGEVSGKRSPVLLHQPGQLPEQAHVYCPRRKKALRHDFYKSVYTGIGRFLGLSLWFNQAIPLIFTRPVLKFLLDKEDEITFDDLAFHNTTLYSTFSQMIIDASSPELSEEEFQEVYSCNFEFSVNDTQYELIPGGSNVKVTKMNAMELARLSAMTAMVESIRPDLEAMRCGLQQIIPKELLMPLSAEDFQLLLSGGIGDIDMTRLKSIIRFNNSRNCSKESLERFKGWFWSIIREMTPSQRMKLLYFLTGSSVLPAFSNVIGNNEEIAVTVDIIGQSSTSLPVASTCGQRLSLPLYESKKELKRKLLTAIECETYGLG